MRELTSHKVNGCNDALSIHVLDEPGSGGACHRYLISTPAQPLRKELEHPRVYCNVDFQNGPIKEAGTNGVTHEALLAILEDRLASFQSGPYACDENAVALAHIREAQAVLKSRTEKRLARGVEGTHQL